MDEQQRSPVGFDPDEVATGEPTRSARLKWVVVLDAALPAGRAVNAAVWDTLVTLRDKAAASLEVFVCDMPVAAQHTRVYDEYLAQVATTAGGELACYTVSIVGPRNRVDRLVGRLPLMA